MVEVGRGLQRGGGYTIDPSVMSRCQLFSSKRFPDGREVAPNRLEALTAVTFPTSVYSPANRVVVCQAPKGAQLGLYRELPHRPGDRLTYIEIGYFRIKEAADAPEAQ